MEKSLKKAWLLPLFICALMSCFVLTSCGNESKVEPNFQNNPTEMSKEHPLTSKLKGTSWHIDSKTNNDGEIDNSSIITDVYFTDIPYNNDVLQIDYLNDKTYYVGYVNYKYDSEWGSNKIAWRLDDAYGNGSFLSTCLLTDNSSYRIQYELIAPHYGVKGSVLDLSSNSMVVGHESGLLRVYFSPSQWRDGNESGNGGGGSISYEKPEIGLESYDCYTNSIIAYYRIYNQENAKVTSAKGYYGASSASTSVNATVGGTRITVKFSGLKANTTYYIKCTATGKGGSGSSETTRLSTTR